MDASQDAAVKVADFAEGSGSGTEQKNDQGEKGKAPLQSPPPRISTPQSKQSWDAFIDQ